MLDLRICNQKYTGYCTKYFKVSDFKIGTDFKILSELQIPWFDSGQEAQLISRVQSQKLQKFTR